MEEQIVSIKTRVILYPVYINSKNTIAEGRQIGGTKACENPTCIEIGDCCSHLKLRFAIEIDKTYPRGFMRRGTVRVLLKREDGTLYNPAISSRKQLMLHVAELVPRHTGRTKKQEPASSTSTGTSKSSKGWKKKRQSKLLGMDCHSFSSNVSAFGRGFSSLIQTFQFVIVK